MRKLFVKTGLIFGFLALLVSCSNILQPTARPRSSTNAAPAVTLTVSDTSPSVGEMVTFTTVATDADGDTLTYTWYLNDVQQSATDANVTWTPTESGSFVIKVVVSDGSKTAEASKVIVVSAVGTLRVSNQSEYAVWYIYASASTSAWGNDLLGSSTLLAGNYKDFTLPVGTYYFRAETSSTYNVYWQTTNMFTITEGGTFTWTLN